MGHRLAAIAMAPILWFQGWRVRRMVPRLPEPDGARRGEQGTGAPLRLLIVGDSAAAGVGVDHQGQALSGQLVATLAADFKVSWRLIAQTGLTGRDLLDWLRKEPPETFDAVIVSIGVNDVTAGTVAVSWQATIGALVRQFESRFRVRHILFSSVPPMDQFPSMPWPLRWYLGKRVARLNQVTSEVLQEREHAELVPFELPREPGLFAADGFHPGALGYSLWAAHLAGLTRRRWLDLPAPPRPTTVYPLKQSSTS